MSSSSGRLIRVFVGGITMYTTLEDMAQCLEELNSIIVMGTAEEADLDCVFKALNYLKRYKLNDPRVLSIIRTVEAILKSDIETGKVRLW